MILTLAGCGYHLRGTGSFLPPSIKTMSIPVFKNLTTRYELDIKLTRAVINEMVARGKVAIAADPEKADAVLEGEVISFSATPVAFTGQARADRYTITVKAKIVLKDRAADKTIFSNPSFIYVEEYEVPPGKDFESVQTEAIDKVAEKFARSLVVTILEGF
jgi:outer membrane lipopolysaccharide assembly protein LptE/RlpB